MAWFKRETFGLVDQKKKDLPGGLWLKCEQCGEIIYKKELDRNSYVCWKCGYHFRMIAKNYIKLLLDDGKFDEFNENIKSEDPLKFKAAKKYSDQLKTSIKKTGTNEAVSTGFGKIENHRIVFVVMNFSFIGGSMGSVVGEKIARATDVAIKEKLPLIIISASGGARMMEGALSLMQMAKTSAYLAKLSDSGLPFISIVTNPTTGGVSASYAMLGDVIIAEPGALIGFAGPRVIKQTIGQDLPEGFQTAEFLMEHGFIDAIYPRNKLKEQMALMISFFEKDNRKPNGKKEENKNIINE